MGSGTSTDRKCATLIITALPEQSTQNERLSVPKYPYPIQNAEQLEKLLSVTRLALEEMGNLRAHLSRKKVAIEKLQAEGSPLPFSEQVRTELDKALTTTTLAERFYRYITAFFELNQAIIHAWNDGELDQAQAYAKWQYLDFNATSAHCHTIGTKVGAMQPLWDKLQSITTEPDERAVASTQLWDEWEMIERSCNCVEDECKDEA